MDNVAPTLRVLVRRGEGTAWLLLLMAGLLVGGCNVFEGLSPGPNNIDALVADARTALADGNASRAVRLLERAYDKDSTSVRVRIELANALYAERDLDLFALRAAAEHLAGTSESSAPATAGKAAHSESMCTDAARPESDANRYEAVPIEAAPLRRWVDRQSVVERVYRLVVTGVLERRPEAFSGATTSVRQKGFLVGAITVVANEVIGARAVIAGTGSALYLDRASNPHRALVVCSGTGDTLSENHNALCALSAAAQQGVQWLQARYRSSETDQGAVLIDRLQALSNAVGTRIDCS